MKLWRTTADPIGAGQPTASAWFAEPDGIASGRRQAFAAGWLTTSAIRYRFAAARSCFSSSAVRRGPYPGVSRWMRQLSLSGPTSTVSKPN